MEWLSTINPTLFPADSAAEMVRKLTQPGAEKDSMAYSVLEDKLRQRLRESEERGEARGIRLGEERGIARERELLREQASRKFGDAAGRRVAAALAEIGDEAGLLRVGRWIIDCATAAELLARIDAGNPSA